MYLDRKHKLSRCKDTFFFPFCQIIYPIITFYWITRPFWGKGICTEALRMAVIIDRRIAFKKLSSINQIYSQKGTTMLINPAQTQFCVTMRAYGLLRWYTIVRCMSTPDTTRTMLTSSGCRSGACIAPRTWSTGRTTALPSP